MYKTKKDIDKMMKEKYGKNMDPNKKTIEKKKKDANPSDTNDDEVYKTLIGTDRNIIKKIAKYLEIETGRKHTDTLVEEIIEEVGKEKAMKLLKKAKK